MNRLAHLRTEPDNERLLKGVGEKELKPQGFQMTRKFLVCVGSKIAMQSEICYVNIAIALGFGLVQIKIYKAQRMGLENFSFAKMQRNINLSIGGLKILQH